MNWTHRERFDCVMAGEIADRSPVSAWMHSRSDEYPGGPLADWTMQFNGRWDWDWIKINPRATYGAEAWGNRYRTGDYETRDIPRQVGLVIDEAKDLDRIVGLPPDAPIFAEQVRLLERVHLQMPEIPVQHTLFSPLSVLLQLAGISYYTGKPVFGLAGRLTAEELLTQRSGPAHRALRAIATSLAGFVQELRRAGADGIFYAVTGTAHPDITPPEVFDEYSLPYDRMVLDSADGLRNIVHTCGSHADPTRFADLATAISWDQYSAGNPTMAEFAGAVAVGGVDHRGFVADRANQIRVQAAAAATIGRTRPVLVTPTCSILSTDVDDAGLAALRGGVCPESAADSGR